MTVRPAPLPARLLPARPLRSRLLPALLPVALAAAALLPAAGAARTPQAAPALRAVPAASTSTLLDLQRRLNAALSNGSATAVGAAVDADGVGSLWRRSSGTAMAPASTEKLFTTLAALRALGPYARFSTQVRATGQLVSGRLVGNLFLVGGGDPFLSQTQLNHLAAAVHAAGITSVSGRLYVDDFRYDQVHAGPGWKAAWVPEESGPLSALALDGNAWRTDAAYLADPDAGNVARFQQLLAHNRVTVSARVGRAHVPSGARVVAAASSAPVRDVVRSIDKASVNFGAEMLLKEIGHLRRGTGSTAAGAAGLHDVLLPIGVQIGTVADGSGLSRSDRQSALQELSLLTAAEGSGLAGALQRALPVACVDGTLVHRMCGTAAAGKVFAKTGSLDSVRTLTGWTTTADGHRVRFAFLLGGVSSSAKATAALDAAAVVLASARLDG
ncbi:MAG: D-alanyl-D-alanine carboxypeptidase/D-alanyl-D-alanine endopeptidase [Nocardioidaceae bacterium]